jgi:hypothetical protein
LTLNCRHKGLGYEAIRFDMFEPIRVQSRLELFRHWRLATVEHRHAHVIPLKQ